MGKWNKTIIVRWEIWKGRPFAVNCKENKWNCNGAQSQCCHPRRTSNQNMKQMIKTCIPYLSQQRNFQKGIRCCVSSTSFKIGIGPLIVKLFHNNSYLSGCLHKLTLTVPSFEGVIYHMCSRINVKPIMTVRMISYINEFLLKN